MKQETINKLEEYISDELDKIMNDNSISKEDKMEAFNVYFNVYQFLKDYDKNIQMAKKDRFKGDERDGI